MKWVEEVVLSPICGGMTDKKDILMDKEVLDSQFVLNHVGMKVVVKNCIQHKSLTKESLIDYISKTFQLKLKDYQVWIKDDMKDIEYQRILPSNDISTKHMDDMFKLSDGTVVRGDFHHVDNTSDVLIRQCVKKVRMDEIEKINGKIYLARGIYNTDSLNVKFQANRGGFQEHEGLHAESMTKLEQWFIDHEFKTPDTPKEKKVKDEKGLKELMSDSIMKLYNNPKYKDIMLQLAGSLSKLGIPGTADSVKSQDEEWEIYAIDQQIVNTGSKPKGKILRGKRKKKKKARKKREIGEPGTDRTYNGYQDGGHNTVLQPKDEGPDETETTIIPDLPPISAKMVTSTPVSEIAVRDGRLVWIVNSANETGSRVADTGRAKDSLLNKVCANKALSDYVAKQENYTWEQASELWEYLQS